MPGRAHRLFVFTVFNANIAPCVVARAFAAQIAVAMVRGNGKITPKALRASFDAFPPEF
jgi:hypothetical protein